jgi:hypothetical protein
VVVALLIAHFWNVVACALSPSACRKEDRACQFNSPVSGMLNDAGAVFVPPPGHVLDTLIYSPRKNAIVRFLRRTMARLIS